MKLAELSRGRISRDRVVGGDFGRSSHELTESNPPRLQDRDGR